MNPVRHVIEVIRTRGLSDVPRVVARGFWGNVNSVYVARRLDEPLPLSRILEEPHEFVMRPMTRDDVDSVAPCLPPELMRRSLERTRTWLRAHFDAGGLAFLVLRCERPYGGLFAHRIGPGQVELDLLGGRYVEPVYLLHKGFVVPESRGQGVGKIVFAYAFQSLADLGAGTLVSQIPEENVASLKVNCAVGFRVVTVVRTTWRFGRSRTVRLPSTPACTTVGFRSYFAEHEPAPR